MSTEVYKALVVLIGVFVGCGLAVVVLVVGIRASLRAGNIAGLLAKRHKLLAKGDREPLRPDEVQDIVSITTEIMTQTKDARVLNALEVELDRARSAKSACDRGDWPAVQELLAGVGRRMVRMF